MYKCKKYKENKGLHTNISKINVDSGTAQYKSKSKAPIATSQRIVDNII